MWGSARLTSQQICHQGSVTLKSSHQLQTTWVSCQGVGLHSNDVHFYVGLLESFFHSLQLMICFYLSATKFLFLSLYFLFWKSVRLNRKNCKIAQRFPCVRFPKCWCFTTFTLSFFLCLNIFPEMDESKRPTWCLFTSKYFSVHLPRTFSHITTVQCSKAWMNIGTIL